MKPSTNIILFAVLFLFMGFDADAQRKGGTVNPEEMADKETKTMVEKLGLTKAQTDRVKELNLTYAKRMQEVRETNADNRTAMKEIMEAVKNEKSAEMKTVLNAEQFKAYEEMQENSKQRSGQRGRGGRGGRGGMK